MLIDRENYTHTPDLYAVWNIKSFMLDHECQGRARGTYCFWMDAGSFRFGLSGNDLLGPTALARVVEPLFRENEDRVLLGLMEPLDVSLLSWNRTKGPIDRVMVEGTFFGGTPGSLDWWRTEFFSLHDEYLQKGFFIGKDQNIMNSLAVLHPTRILFFSGYPQGANGCSQNGWFRFQQLLRDPNYRPAACDDLDTKVMRAEELFNALQETAETGRTPSRGDGRDWRPWIAV
uniref:Uncharacterized protein n=1 Tax=Chromera velia CCMP2878 TaxID=1169474 RepID=A0A0G4I2H0_9ALVE|eukprot:Cvel_10363.t1-p1 / transcript=Cvel_10363.t1 / gene=Cvel_10363 / organism=Chromera_velia_CCMP2878 / gene_product=hypothetical protein / transcript_product=hypothetical protein / location=Cvel_scaffold623:29847-30536(-) / protein_length=230 / sequence_SO=supercontig / SO=protein_coding / is_pseudo=false